MANEKKEKEKSPEELQKEKEEALAKGAEVSKKNLESPLWDYASPKLITHEGYGQLAESAIGFYNEALSKSPDQHIYEQIFLPQLLSEGGAVTNPYIQSTSYKILQESLQLVKIEDAMKYAGVKEPIKAEYAGKYVHQLGKEAAGAIMHSALQYQTDEVVKKVLSSRQAQVSSDLEKMVCEPPKKDDKEPNK
jgi:hypothetical protein